MSADFAMVSLQSGALELGELQPFALAWRIGSYESSSPAAQSNLATQSATIVLSADNE